MWIIGKKIYCLVVLIKTGTWVIWSLFNFTAWCDWWFEKVFIYYQFWLCTLCRQTSNWAQSSLPLVIVIIIVVSIILLLSSDTFKKTILKFVMWSVSLQVWDWRWNLHLDQRKQVSVYQLFSFAEMKSVIVSFCMNNSCSS